MALAAAGGILFIEDDTVRLAFLGVCLLALGASAFRAESDSPGGDGGADFWVPIIAAIVISSLAFEDDQQKLASIIVLTLVFSIAWRSLRRRRGAVV